MLSQHNANLMGSDVSRGSCEKGNVAAETGSDPTCTHVSSGQMAGNHLGA